MMTYDEKTERVIKFRRSEEPSQYDEQQARLDRIKASLQRINDLMDEIKSVKIKPNTKVIGLRPVTQVIDATDRFKKGE